MFEKSTENSKKTRRWMQTMTDVLQSLYLVQVTFMRAHTNERSSHDCARHIKFHARAVNLITDCAMRLSVMVVNLCSSLDNGENAAY